MRKTEDFRPENRGAYGGEYREEAVRKYGKTDRKEAVRADHENIYRELSAEGRRFCAAAGLLEEIVVLAAFGIRVSMSPIPVLAFLWVLFVILTAAALIGVSCLLDRVAAFRSLPERSAARQGIRPLPVRRAAAGRCRRETERTERIAA